MCLTSLTIQRWVPFAAQIEITRFKMMKNLCETLSFNNDLIPITNQARMLTGSKVNQGGN